MIEPQSRNLGPAITVLGVLALLVSHGLAVEVCFTPNDLQGWNVAVDCDPLNHIPHANAWTGYAESTVPCASTDWCPDLDYGWTISSSETDPHEYTGVLPAPTADLYLWVSCVGYFGGWQWAEFAVEATGAEIVAYEERNGVQNLGTATDLYLVPPGGCSDQARLLVGRWTVDTAVHIEAGAWGSIKSLYR